MNCLPPPCEWMSGMACWVPFVLLLLFTISGLTLLSGAMFPPPKTVTPGGSTVAAIYENALISATSDATIDSGVVDSGIRPLDVNGGTATSTYSTTSNVAVFVVGAYSPTPSPSPFPLNTTIVYIPVFTPTKQVVKIHGVLSATIAVHNDAPPPASLSFFAGVAWSVFGPFQVLAQGRYVTAYTPTIPPSLPGPGYITFSQPYYATFTPADLGIGTDINLVPFINVPGGSGIVTKTVYNVSMSVFEIP